MLKALSILGYLAMVAGTIGALLTRSLFSASPIVIAAQVAAAGVLLWARITFGRRSFHFAGNPTAGGLVTTGPYRFIRHPIYASFCLFVWAGLIAHCSVGACGLGLLVLAGALVRVFCEERLVRERYPEYGEYAARTKRLVPFLF